MAYSSAIKKLIDQFAQLPGIGPKTAERLVFYLLSKPKIRAAEFAAALEELSTKVTRCAICQNFSETNPCQICSDPQRDGAVICVVAKPQDISAIEKVSEFRGRYHVLGGLIDALAAYAPTDLTVKELLARVKANGVKEIILALSSDLPGETTTLYLAKLLKQLPGVTITRLARGLPMGSDIEFADEVTLGSALSNRKTV